MGTSSQPDDGDIAATAPAGLQLSVLARRIKRLSERESKVSAEHKGNEQNYTYHGGYSLGYLQGQLSALHDVHDALENKTEGLDPTASQLAVDDIATAIKEEAKAWTGDNRVAVCVALSDLAKRLGLDVSKEDLLAENRDQRKSVRPF